MKRLMITSLIAALVFPIHAAVLQDSTPAEQADEFEAVTEDIEIMKRVLQKALEEHFAERSGIALKADELSDNTRQAPRLAWTGITAIMKSQLGAQRLIADTWHTPALNIEGFYAPGVGVIYTLNLPAAIKYADLAKAKPDPAGDDWDRIEDGLRNPKTNYDWLVVTKTPAKRPIIDREDLDRAIDVLVNTVGRYGSRIERLAKDESIIIVARVNVVQGPVAGSDLTVARGYLIADLIAGGPVPALRLTIRMSADAMRSYKGGGLDSGKLRDRATVTLYRAYSTGSKASLNNLWPVPRGN